MLDLLRERLCRSHLSGSQSQVLERTHCDPVRQTETMTGHLFVTVGDLTQIRCDGVLVPTDADFMVEDSFCGMVGLDRRGELSGHSWNDQTVVRSHRGPEAPGVWLADIGRAGLDPARPLEAAAAFIAEAAANLKASGVPRPLLAIPALGTGYGGGGDIKGEVYERLVPALYEAAGVNEADVVLVTRSRREYAAAQQVRKRMQPDTDNWAEDWFFLGDGARDSHISEAARGIAARTGNRELVLFVGAGVSASAQLPSWQGLLDALATNLPETHGLSLDALHLHDFRDQATVITRRYKQAGLDLADELRKQLPADRHGLTHQLLASLPTTEAATTNYDQLFEQAVAATGDTLAVLPREPANRQDRWLLKLHGDIENSASIVLTRRDYLQAPLRHGALFGLVQAMLMTRHMLFVGYSLTDEDFHKLVDEVRSARRGVNGGVGPDTEPFGTVLTLFDDPLFGDLWSDDLDIVAMAPAPADPTRPTAKEIKGAARRLQIFLDLVGMLASDGRGYVLDETFEAMLTEKERALAESLKTLEGSVPADAGTEWKPVAELLERFGSHRATERG